MLSTIVLSLNIIASAFWILMLLPQVYKTIKTKDTHSISLMMFLLYPIANIIWVTNAIIMIVATHTIDNVGVIVVDSIFFILSCTILFIKFKNIKMAKKLKITEVEYYNQYLKNKKENKFLLFIETKIKEIFKKG